MPLANDVLLHLWDRARLEHPIDRALSILRAFTGGRREELAALSIAQRDALLVASRVSLFGRKLTGSIACQLCPNEIEVAICIDELAGIEDRGDTSVEFGGSVFAVRAPDSFDAAAIVGCDDPAEARCELARRCLGREELPPELVDAADRALQQSCAFAALDCETRCSMCAAAFTVPVAIDEFLWTEIRWQAERLLNDVVTLARYFGWSEDAVLALSDTRRAHYREYVQ